MSDELKWHEAFELLRADHGARAQIKTCDGAWTTVRMAGGALEYEDHDGRWLTWSNVGAAMTPQWRRVPKAPSLHELPGDWRARADDLGRWAANACASELDAVLREGDYVSLRGVTPDEVESVYRNYAGDVRNSLAGLLAYLRARKVQP